jgi:hypothetical protein
VLLADLPQGSLKKIKLQLLLPDLALQFRDPSLGDRKIIRWRRRPRPRNASAPPALNRSRQTYRSSRRTRSSRANPLAGSPATIRRMIKSLKSRLKTRADRGIQFSSARELYPFSVSHFRGPLHPGSTGICRRSRFFDFALGRR